MFLSNENTLKLDELMKSFEVAYRSYVCDVIVNEFKTSDELLTVLNNINISESTLVNSGKYTAKLSKLKKNIVKIYKKVKYSYNSFKNKMVIEDNGTSDRVLYVSDLIDILILLANPHFNNLYKPFDTKDQFVYYSEVYKDVRNALSHPASAKISIEETKTIILYTQHLLGIMDDKYFWYFDKESIKENINNLTESISDMPNIINNLNEIATQYKKVIGRDKELNVLSKWILGEEGSYRTANSVVAYGYGGIGKTTLVVEFIYELLKNINDKGIENKYKYILFFSSKDEKLEVMQTSGKLYIDSIRQQISSFDDFKKSLCNYLNIESTDDKDIYDYMNRNEGIIVVDNIENLTNKNCLIEFMKRSPRTVQYIVTSRNEEMCEEKLNVLGFDEKNNGMEFIDQYIESNEFNLSLTLREKEELIRASVGNTLILVTSLERVKSNKSTINGIIDELMNISSYNTQQIADFMYKNTFDQTLDELKEYNVEQLLTIIALYEEPINLYAMSELTGIEIRKVEYMCEILTSKLVLYKAQDLFNLNDFASKFIFSQILPDEIELSKLIKRIDKYKTGIKTTLEKVEKIKSKNKFLEEVLDDWKPQNNTDKITIANAFSLYSTMSKELDKIKKALKKNNKIISTEDIKDKVEYVENEFGKYELKTGHPYIRYQKARVYKLFIDSKICDDTTREVILNRMKKNFEQVRFSVEFHHQYIKKTLSYAAFLWIYGTFLRIYIDDYTDALNILSQSKKIYNNLSIKDVNYVKLCNELAICYNLKYKDSKDALYLEKCKEMCNNVLEMEDNLTVYKKGKIFDFERFKQEFKHIIQ